MNTVIFLMGPTAAGKTAVALALASQLPCTLISVDSAQVYRGLDIGTAKPDPQTLARAPHKLIDIVDPDEIFNASMFRELALKEIEESLSTQRIPILVGGTMLYFQVLRAGLAALPDADATVRAAIDTRAVQLGWAALHAELAEVDPVSAAWIHPNDSQRIQRALEVHQLTGKPLSQLQQHTTQADFPYAIEQIIIAPETRALLHQRIEARFAVMLTQGLVDEVKHLKTQYNLSLAHPSMRTVGYRQIGQYLAGEFEYAEMVTKAVAASRQMAKRQLTWLRRVGEDDQRYHSDDPDLMTKIMSHIKQIIDT